MRAAVIAVAAENEFFTVWTEHREGVEAFVATDLFHILSLEVAEIHIEWKTSFIFMIAAKDKMLAIGREIRCPVGLL
jgi:hypothetical protein